MRPRRATPGSAVEVATSSTPSSDRSGRCAPGCRSPTTERGVPPAGELEVLHASDDELVVRVPERGLRGPRQAARRLRRGRETAASPTTCASSAVNHRKLFREVLGGLALLFFGLRLMSRGSRQYTGHRSQGCSPASGGAPPRRWGWGWWSAASPSSPPPRPALVVGLIESHLLAVGPAVAVLLGAQLGAAVAPSVLGLVSTREGLLVVSIGRALAERWPPTGAARRFGKIILGCGLLFFGLHLLRHGLRAAGLRPRAAALHRSLPRGHLSAGCWPAWWRACC